MANVAGAGTGGVSSLRKNIIGLHPLVIGTNSPSNPVVDHTQALANRTSSGSYTGGYSQVSRPTNPIPTSGYSQVSRPVSTVAPKTGTSNTTSATTAKTTTSSGSTGGVGGIGGSGGGSLDAQRLALEALMKKNADSYYNTQVGMHTKARDNAIAQLQMAYENAVAEGKISMDEARNQFADAKAQIEEQSYLDAQRSQVYGNEMGIQNSQQMLALQAGDNARANKAVNTASTERDRRINELQNRINSITKQKDLDIANQRNTFDANLTQARGQADQMYNQGLLGLRQGDYEAARSASYRSYGSPSGYNIDDPNKKPIADIVQNTASNLANQYNQFKAQQTRTPNDDYFDAMKQQIYGKAPVRDDWASKHIVPPRQNALLKPWEQYWAMFGRN